MYGKLTFELEEKYMDLFEYAKSRTMENESPLASRLRPTKLEEVVGQQHIVEKINYFTEPSRQIS